MGTLNLDYLAGTRSHWAGKMVLATGAAVLISAVWCYRDLSHEVADQELLVSRLQERGKGGSALPVMEMRDAEQTARETKQANTAIRALSLPWKQLFEAFEATRTNEVAVLAIEPDPQKGLVRISAETKKFESMLKYASSLQKVTLFREVLVLSHEIQEQDPQKPIRFVLQAAWETQQ